jgi:hypothetical protein
VLIEDEITDTSLRALLSRHAVTGSPASWQATPAEMEAARKRLRERFRRIGLASVVTGGLVDGVNPCAFATIVFFITYLAAMGKARARILAAGIAFCSGVFVSYFATGLGLSEVLLTFRSLPVLALIIHWGTVALVSLLAVLSFYDAWIAWRGSPHSMLLTIPSKLRSRMQGIIARRGRSASLLGASFVLGLGISMIELVCTGQVYLPLIQVMLSLAVDRMQTIGMLAVYNTAFCIPLLAVFLAAFLGVSSKGLNAFLLKHIGPAKVLLGVFFIGLAVTLLVLGG